MPHGNAHDQRILRLVQSIGYATVPPLTTDAFHQGGIGMDATHALYLVVGCLAQQYDGAYGIVHIAIAGCLTTPGRAIDHDVALVANTHHGVVVVYQFGALNIFQPQSGVGALTRSARSEEHIALALMTHHGCMKQYRMLIGSSQRKEHHQGIVDGHLGVLACHEESSVMITVCADQPPRCFLPPAELEHDLTRVCSSADDFLSLVFLT